MSDILSKRKRSAMMSKIRSENTKPEWILRCGLHRLGFRYRLRKSDLVGRPDLVFPKFRAAVFVHGCYWHRHPGCKDASMPKSNVDFWAKKFAENVERDRRTERQLVERGWRIMVVWECELNRNTLQTIQKVAVWLEGESDPVQTESYEVSRMSRSKLLAVAEKKVRYRLDTYDKNLK